MAVLMGLMVLGTLSLVAWLLVCWYLDVRRIARVAASLPGPAPLPVLGNFVDILHDPGHVLRTFKGLLDTYGYTMRVWLGPFLAVFVMDADDAEVVFQSQECAVKPHPVYKYTEPVLGRGMVNINGTAHRRHRKLIQPSLHRDMLVEFFPFMRGAVQDLLDSLKPLAQTGEVFNAKPLCGVAALSSTFLTILNADSDLYSSDADQRLRIVRNVDRLSELLMYRVLRPWYFWEWVFSFDPNYPQFKDLTTAYDEVITKVLDHKLDRRARGMAPPPRKRLAFLDHVLAADSERSLTREELHDELKTMVAAGFVTSMDAISMMMLLLSIMPEHQQKIHQELDDIFDGEPNRAMELSDLDHMEYTERFIKETMRYFPPFPVLGRACAKDMKLPSGHVIPRGAYIGLSPLAMHWNPKYFPEPERFDPDRFLPEVARTRNPFAYVPFSAGPRNCIGQRYAMMFLKTCLSSVLRRYDVLPDPKGPKHIKDISMGLGVTYYPKQGAHLSVQERQRPAPAGG